MSKYKPWDDKWSAELIVRIIAASKLPMKADDIAAQYTKLIQKHGSVEAALESLKR